MAKKKSNSTKALALYNKILKEFTAINAQLPEDRKMSVKERRQLIKERIYPQFWGNAASRVSKKVINQAVVEVLDTIPPKEACDINFMSPTVYANVAWFDIDEYIRTVLPDCIFVRIDAGTFGSTRIFNTRNYQYNKSGIKKIVEKIRETVDDNSGVDVSFTGIKKLRKGKTNDGTPENYFIDFIVVIDGTTESEPEPIIYEIPKEKKKQAKRVKQVIMNRIKDLAKKKKRKKRARKSANQTISMLKRLNYRQRISKKPETKDNITLMKLKLYQQRIKILLRDYKNGLLTDEQYLRRKDEIERLIDIEYRKGGKIK